MSVDLHKYISGSEHQTYDGCTLTGTRYHKRLEYLKDQRSREIGTINLGLRRAVSLYPFDEESQRLTIGTCQYNYLAAFLFSRLNLPYNFMRLYYDKECLNE